MNFVNCDKIGHYKDKYRYNCRSKKLYEPLMVITNIDYDFGNRDNRNMNFYCNTEYEKMDKNYKYNCDPIKVITNEEYDFENNAINYRPENRHFLDEYKKEKKRKIIEQGYESDDDGAVYNATCSTKYNDEDEDDEDERKKPKNSFKSKTKTKKSKTKKSKTKKSKSKTKKSKTKKSKTKKKSLNK